MDVPFCPNCQVDHPALVKQAQEAAIAAYGQVSYDEYERLRDRAIELGRLAAKSQSSVKRDLGAPTVGHVRYVCVSCGHRFTVSTGVAGNYTEDSLRSRMIALIDQGLSLRQICQQLPVSKTTVQRYRMMRQTGEESVTPIYNLNDTQKDISLDALKGIVLEPKRDEDFYPLLLYKGSQTMGRTQSMWNYVRAMLLMETPNLSQAVKFGMTSPDARHLLGLHAAPQHMGLRGFMSRLWFTPEVRDRVPHMQEYLAWFAGGNPHRFYWEYTKVPRYSTWKTNRAWRIDYEAIARRAEAVERRALAQEHKEERRYLTAHEREAAQQARIAAAVQRAKDRALRRSQGKPVAAVMWPFISGDVSHDHALLMQIDGCVPKSLPEQVRQDVCQDLVVAVLSGDVSLGDLQGSVRTHVGNVFKMHPMKYGPLSLDAPAPWQHEDSRPLSHLLVAE